MRRWLPRSLLAVVALVALAQHFSSEPVARKGPSVAVAANVPHERIGAAVPLAGEAAARLRPGAMPDDAIAIPVVGITRSQLRDTWGEARSGGRRHAAIDILAPRGTPVVAAVDGEILRLLNSRAGGLTVYLADSERDVLYYYAHLDRYADGLDEGARVRQGTILGEVGTSGNAPPAAPHLHFSIERLPAGGEWWKGVPENPYPLLMERGFTVSALRGLPAVSARNMQGQTRGE